MYPTLEVLLPPLETQEASYLAASVRIVSFSKTSMRTSLRREAREKNLLMSSHSSAAGMTARGTLDCVNEAEDLRSQKYNTQQHEKESPTCHNKILLIELLF